MNIEEIVQAVLAQMQQQPMTENNDETLLVAAMLAIGIDVFVVCLCRSQLRYRRSG